MPSHIEIELGGAKFKASYFTFGQAADIEDAIKDLASKEFRRQIKGNCDIIAAGLSEHHPEMTAERLAGLRGKGMIAQMVAATRAILVLNEYEIGPEPGKAPAAAATA